jgi:hypothetical protein
MATAAEYWYVRLPDGRTLRARSSDVLRTYLRAGRIPWDSRVRRTGAEEWLPLIGVSEFADVFGTEPPHDDGLADGPPGRDLRPTGNELRAVGMRALVEELLNAFDSTLNRGKLTAAAITGVALAVGVIAFEQFAAFPLMPWGLVGFIAAALFLLIAVAVGTVLLTQTTVIELDRHRPAHASEVRAGLLRQTLRVGVAHGLIAGLLVAIMLFLRAASPWLATHDLGDLNPTRDLLLSVVAVLRLLVEVVCWPIIGLAVLLLGPLLVIEEYPILRSLREWLGMLRRHLGRIYLYEALAFTLATILALPMLLLVGVAAYSVGTETVLAERITLFVLAGLALTPMIAYLTVANVFIYINLRYEFFYSARERN